MNVIQSIRNNNNKRIRQELSDTFFAIRISKAGIRKIELEYLLAKKAKAQ